MPDIKTSFSNVDEYLLNFPVEVRVKLEKLRTAIRKAAPKAEEVISYGMPAYKQNGMLVYFAGYKGHIGFYPTGNGVVAFKKEIEGYKFSKGTIQFPLEKAIPVQLVSRIVKFRLVENLKNLEAKKTAGKASKMAIKYK